MRKDRSETGVDDFRRAARQLLIVLTDAVTETSTLDIASRAVPNETWRATSGRPAASRSIQGFESHPEDPAR